MTPAMKALAPPFRLIAAAVAVVAGVEGVSYVAGGWVDALLRYLPGIDKVLHVAGFFTIYGACRSIVARYAPSLPTPTLILALTIGMLAVGDEIGQGQRPDRQQERGDVVASLCGLTLGIAWTERRHWPKLAAAGGVSAALVAAFVIQDSIRTQRHLNQAARLERAGDFVGARKEYRAALDAGAQSAGLYNELGWVEIESGEGDPRQAVEWARKALTMRPADPDIWDTYGWALHHAGRSAEALPFLERALTVVPDMFCIHYHLGRVLLALGDRPRAESHFRQQMEFRDTREAGFARKALEEMGLQP